MTYGTLAFEAGTTMVELLRVIAEESLRRGFVVGFTTGAVKDEGIGAPRDESMDHAYQMAYLALPTLDVHWHAEPDAQMLVLALGGIYTPVIGVTQRTYETLNALAITSGHE